MNHVGPVTIIRIQRAMKDASSKSIVKPLCNEAMILLVGSTAMQ